MVFYTLELKEILMHCSFGAVSAELFKTPPSCFNYELALGSTMPIKIPPLPQML